MADEVQVEAVPSASVRKTAKVIADSVPSGSLVSNYGALGGGAAVLFAVLEFFKSQGGTSAAFVAALGTKWVLWFLVAILIWDIVRRLLKLLGRLVAHVGEWASNQGRIADGQNALASAVQSIAAKSDRTTEEQARLTTFAVQTAQRSVEVSVENNQLLKQLLAKAGGGSA